MSQLQTNINLPSVDSIDGFATTSSVVSIITSMEDELDNFGNAIGNIYNDGDYSNNTPKMINSVGESIGSELIDPAMPFGKTFSNFTESKVLSGSKTAILKLNANTSNSITVQGYNSSNAPTTTYNLATNPYSMLPNECYINGRYIVFKDPPYQFSITYDGTYADSSYLEKDGYMPNIIPNLYNPSYSRPTLTIESGKIKVSINNANAIKSESAIDDQYTITLANYLAPFVDPTGNTPCPKAYISAFIYRASTSKFSKLECNNIYVLSPKSYYLDTDESVDLANDLILISIANTTIKEWLLVAIRELENHKHDGMDISSPIRHETLDGLLPSSDNPNIKYAKSITPNNEHVQYLHREGYNASDEGAYGNAMLGDLLIGSTSSSSLFNNTLQDSNKVLFGSTNGNGHGLYRRSVINGDVLDIASSTNGLLVSYEYNNQYKYGIGISTNSSGIHKFSNRHDNNNLLISSNNDKTTFGKHNNTLESYVLSSVEMGTLDVGIINLNPVSISKSGGTSALISSSDTNSFLNITTKVGIYNNTISGGIRFTDGANTFAKIFASKENGTLATAIDSKTVFATSSDLYLIKNITDTTAGISLENRANIYVGDVFCYTIGTSKTSGSTKNGFKIGDDHSIYLTENVDSTANTLVLEANNKVILTKPSLTVNVTSPTYTDLQLNDLYAKDVILSGKITGNTESTNSTITNLTVNTSFTCANTCTATFNGPVNFNEAIDFNDNVTIDVLYSEILNANNAYVQNITGEVSTNLKGQITFSPHVTNPSSFTCNVPSVFNKPCIFASTPTFNTGVTFSNSTISTLTSTDFISTNATITSATITSLTITNVLNATGINTPTLDTDNDGIVVNGRIQQIGSTSPNVFQAPMHIAGGIEITSTGQSIDLNNGYVENLQMKTAPGNKDAANVEFVNLKANKNGDSAQVFQVANGVNGNDATNLSQVAGLILTQISTILPPGVIMPYAGVTPPAGWIECNGQSTSGYTALAAVVGSNVPDLRGEFIRGWDHGRGIDTGRGLLTFQQATAIAGTVEAYNYIQIDNGEDSYSAGSPPSDSGDPTYIARTMYRVRPRNIALMYIIKV
ncbi:tail fiber protein [uncultured Flavobacterium sp.]|uniref:tail fiber protein n=1 Tax=uncultured Flavobacterium sp. TaxID=165435 RepID=UPI002592AC4D|nr:tail fiber protein [uncultured Flavobacterium sp.]